MHSGLIANSFAEAGTSQGIELGSENDNNWTSIYGNGRLGLLSGTQKFVDGGSQRSLAFTYYQAQGELGFKIYPLERRKDGMSLFFKLGGTLTTHFLNLDKTATLTTLATSEQSLSAGYNVNLGASYIFANARGGRWGFVTEVAYKAETGTLAGKSDFNFGGFAVSLGLVF